MLDYEFETYDFLHIKPRIKQYLANRNSAGSRTWNLNSNFPYFLCVFFKVFPGPKVLKKRLFHLFHHCNIVTTACIQDIHLPQVERIQSLSSEGFDRPKIVYAQLVKGVFGLRCIMLDPPA